ncbi:hypothetical protein KDA_63760 [Dictyobacter alpinus]|uniref:Uncharacterized protein n=1 Tax=Dictyobacter alpinus TaxID=2014873 RepID=A0A402BI24_9CHLR|nr:hypothetical protein [Dictyobacter alpinus]GCE30892.1 hypothetical protein KDA_63760 [Dictyobacter alpinus]
MSSITYEFALSAPHALSINNGGEAHSYLLAVQTTASTPGTNAGAQHKQTAPPKHVPVNIDPTDTQALVGQPAMPTISTTPFNPTLFLIGLFLLAVSGAMFWYMLKRFRLNKPDIQNLVQ